jgi:hypothetical protein
MMLGAACPAGCASLRWLARKFQVSVDAPEKPKDSAAEDLDVVLLRGATEDGEGARVLRARRGRIEAGEVRPLREGRPLAVGGEVVRLEPRQETSALFDVHVEHVVTAPDGSPKVSAERSGPAQVATSAYRESWERTFGRTRKSPKATLN